jgi:hypothetical protein
MGHSKPTGELSENQPPKIYPQHNELRLQILQNIGSSPCFTFFSLTLPALPLSSQNRSLK